MYNLHSCSISASLVQGSRSISVSCVRLTPASVARRWMSSCEASKCSLCRSMSWLMRVYIMYFSCSTRISMNPSRRSIW